MVMIPCTGLAESKAERILNGVDLYGLESLAASTDTDMNLSGLVRDLVTGKAGLDPQSVWLRVARAFNRSWTSLANALPEILAPALIGALASRLWRRKGHSDAVGLLCYLACAIAETRLLAKLFEDLAALSSRVAALEDAAMPLLCGLLTASGATAAASQFTPMTSLAGRVGQEVIARYGVGLSAVAAAAAVSGNMTSRFPMKRLYALAGEVVNWGAGLILTCFLGALSVQGILSSGYDSTSVRAVRYTVDNLFPAIGSEVADSMDAALSSLLLVKNAVGVSGMALLLGLCAEPFLRLLAALLGLRLAAAVIEPLGEERLCELTGQIAGVARMLLVLSTALIVLALLLLGAVLAVGQNLVR